MQNPPFQFVGNDLALDFVNTRIGVADHQQDLIATPQALAAWLRAASLNCPIENWRARAFTELYRLRESLRRALVADIADPEVLAHINSHLQNHVARRYVAHDAGRFCWRQSDDPMSPEALMALLAKAAAELLVSTERSRIKSCAHPDCVLMFKDTSKSGRRRWCSMETCGNRSKAATFRAGAAR